MGKTKDLFKKIGDTSRKVNILCKDRHSKGQK